LIPLRRCRPNHRECLTPRQKRTSWNHSKNEGGGGAGVYIWEGTTLRVMVANRPYSEFYDFTVSVRNILDRSSYVITYLWLSGNPWSNEWQGKTWLVTTSMSTFATQFTLTPT
jgi:hypothetical protein